MKVVPVGEMETRRSQLRGGGEEKAEKEGEKEKQKEAKEKGLMSLVVVCVCDGGCVPYRVPPFPQCGPIWHTSPPPSGATHMAKQQQAAYRSVCQATCVTPPPTRPIYFSR